MDESLDDYISKSNFKIKIGNTKPKGNIVNKPTTSGSGFQNKKRFTGGFQGKKVTDVSITVPSVQKTRQNNNPTNQMRDARERLVSKNKPVDAREKLKQKAQTTDARQKLVNIRSQKEPQDARAKIQAKKQIQSTQTKDGSFTLTRTVSNNNNNNIQLAPGPRGDIHITRTLTKVMPPGYEHITGPVATPRATGISYGPAGVKNRLGPPSNTVIGLRPTSGPNAGAPIRHPDAGIPTITRTISNPATMQHPQSPLQGPLPHTPFPPTHQNHPIRGPNPNLPPQQTTPVIYREPPHQSSPGYPPPPQTAPYPYQQPGQPAYPEPPVPSRVVPQHTVPAQGPPYPVNDPIGPRQQLSQQPTAMPRIQVQNDQYRPPEPQYPQYAPPPQQYAPPPQHYAPPQPQYAYPPAQQQVPYERPPPESEASTYSQGGFPRESNASVFKRTIINDSPPQQTIPQTSPLKRKLPEETQRHQSSSGPLRSSATNYVPVIDVSRGSERAGTQKPKLTKITAPGEPVAKKMKEEEDADVISPLQGFKVSITNLAHTVTQDDIIELFGAIAAVKSVKLVKPGMSEVVYVKKDGAMQAVKTYHDRELDGLPMVVKLTTPVSARIKEASEKLPASIKTTPGSPLKLSKATGGKGKAPDKKDLDVQVLHKALFKTGSSGTSKPVTFTVNI